MLRPDLLLEAGEAAAVVGAILWLAQTILEALVPAGELDAWLHRVGFADAIGELKSEVERMETVVNGVQGRAVGNKPLARCLARVKQLMYDADDLVDELDYCRLQQQVEGARIEQEGMVRDAAEQVHASANAVVMLAPAIELEGLVGDRAEHADASASTATADISDNNGRKNRSKERDYFHITPAVNGQPARAKCIDCGTQVIFSHGTSVLRKHRSSATCKNKRAAIEEAWNCPSAGHRVQNGTTVSTTVSEGRKRLRTEYSVATTTHLWDNAEFFKRIQEIVLKLQITRDDVIEYLKDSITMSDQYHSNSSDTRVRTSSTLPGKVYGRGEEKDKIIRMIKAANSDNITVLPIVGIIGVGKTTLAKLVYHDQHVERKFERIWVWVSNIFDEVRVTREILDIVTMASLEGSCKRESYERVSNYSKLLEVLKKHMSCLSKKFLLVLDDVCNCMDHPQWKDLLDALGSSCTNGNVIIVTSRNLSVTKMLGTIKPFELRALGNDDFLRLFRACAFGDNNYKEHLDTSLQVCAKLMGNPLAAKSAMEMLREQPTLDHWKSIIDNGIWESLQLRGGIVAALMNIYYNLPYNLQQCFLACSIFPNGHRFHIDSLVSMWISLGFVRSTEIGRGHLDALVNSCFFEQVGTDGDSILHHQQCYVMCGMMHEFARLVSRAEFATIDGLECKEVLPTVRHISIQTGSMCHMYLQSIVSSARRLRTLILVWHYDSLFFQFKFFQTFISNLVNCTHLRYLKLEIRGISEEPLPISLKKFYHLETLDAGCQATIHDLISMKHLVLTNGACNTSCLAMYASLHTFHLEDCEVCETLLSLETLPSLTKLKLRSLPEVVELLIPSLEELVLIDMPKLARCLSNSMRDLNSSLRTLEIKRCRILKAFPLFESCEHFQVEQKSWLPNVSELTIHECPHLVVSIPLPPSSRFCKLSIEKVSTLPKMEGSSSTGLIIGFPYESSSIEFLDDKILSFHNLIIITQLHIVDFKNLLSISLEGLRQLVCLKRLEMQHCPKLFSTNVSFMQAREDMADTDLHVLPSLKCLSIYYCGITGAWLSLILQHVRGLEELNLGWCEKITGLSIQGKDNNLSNVNWIGGLLIEEDQLLCVVSNLVSSLKKMSFHGCELKFYGNKEAGFSEFTSLEELTTIECPELILSLVHEDEISGQTNGRWLLPCSLRVLHICGASLVTLRPCFSRDLTCLTVLDVVGQSLQLHSCTALEKLSIAYCDSVNALEGFQSLCSLKYLEISRCPGLPQCLEILSTQGYELCPRLEKLGIDDPSFLTTPFCKHLTSLQRLQLDGKYVDTLAGLTCEQEAGLQLLTSLQELRFESHYKLSDLPVGLHSLPSLKRLEIFSCPSISRLPERGLPPSLEKLEVLSCSKELTEHCRMLATNKLKVIIDEEHSHRVFVSMGSRYIHDVLLMRDFYTSGRK